MADSSRQGAALAGAVWGTLGASPSDTVRRSRLRGRSPPSPGCEALTVCLAVVRRASDRPANAVSGPPIAGARSAAGDRAGVEGPAPAPVSDGG
ncbi:hypothetical protein C0Z19_25550 [Trinickia soli]|uniref:Uncharacterized protein n=1 Tax=Trinickia soli TaxID=380675 RepID=A0A2N7VHE4_9BURK|nr:hypothetical protein C0Z19_25550 [Trinickia soli]